MNMRSWKKLPADLQQVMLDTLQESVRWQDAELEKINQAAIKRFREHGVQLKELSPRSEEHTSELQSLMRISYAVFCLKQTNHYGTVDSLTSNLLLHLYIT